MKKNQFEILEIVKAGASLILDASKFNRFELVEIASALQPACTLQLTACDSKNKFELIDIARAAPGKVILVPNLALKRTRLRRSAAPRSLGTLGITMPVLFCNVGWMNHYNGIDGDSIERGGKYNQHSTGHEVCNFSNNAGTLYGYVQPTGQIKIEKLGASKKEDFASGVTVVWTAGPETGGTAVVGWYKDATVYREAQAIRNPSALQKKNGVSTYRIKAPADKAVLLPVEQRELMIPESRERRNWSKQCGLLTREESQGIVTRVLALINEKAIPALPDVDQSQSILEGNPRLVAHLRRERNSAIVKAKKEAVLRATGKLCCEACGFDFKDIYGEFGDGFCEVHHLQPLSKADGVVKTELEDLAIVCSNCHRIIHRTDPMLSISSLTKHLLRQRANPTLRIKLRKAGEFKR